MLKFVKHGLRDETLLITKDGMVIDSDEVERGVRVDKSGEEYGGSICRAS